MIITEHGVSEKFYKGITTHAGKRLVFFGYSKKHVMRKELDWIDKNMEALNQISTGRPALTLIQGGLSEQQ